MNIDLTTILSYQDGINLIFCLLIVIFGYLAYSKKNRQSFLYITYGFGLFAFSHVLTLIGLEASWFVVITSIRIAAYCSILFALFKEYKGN